MLMSVQEGDRHPALLNNFLSFLALKKENKTESQGNGHKLQQM